MTFFFRPSENQLYARNMQYLHSSHGRVLFAGSERAPRGFNWMEGAALTGRLTALNLLKAYYGTGWTDHDTKAYTNQIRLWKERGLARLKAEDVLDIPKYIATLFEIAFDTIRHWWDHLFHKAEVPIVKAVLNGHEANFRAPQSPDEEEILHQLQAAVNSMPTADEMFRL